MSDFRAFNRRVERGSDKVKKCWIRAACAGRITRLRRAEGPGVRDRAVSVCDGRAEPLVTVSC